jgi:hypothetical protein
MRKQFKERKLFKGGNYMRKYGMQDHLLLGKGGSPPDFINLEI